MAIITGRVAAIAFNSLNFGIPASRRLNWRLFIKNPVFSSETLAMTIILQFYYNALCAGL